MRTPASGPQARGFAVGCGWVEAVTVSCTLGSLITIVAIGGDRLLLQETVYADGVKGKRLLPPKQRSAYAAHKCSTSHPGEGRDPERQASLVAEGLASVP
jgi:hypothetical protein